MSVEGRLRREALDQADREQFIRDNAVSLVLERDAKIARLRREVTRLNNANHCLRAANVQLRADLLAAANRIAAQSELLTQRADRRPGPAARADVAQAPTDERT